MFVGKKMKSSTKKENKCERYVLATWRVLSGEKKKTTPFPKLKKKNRTIVLESQVKAYVNPAANRKKYARHPHVRHFFQHYPRSF